MAGRAGRANELHLLVQGALQSVVVVDIYVKEVREYGCTDIEKLVRNYSDANPIQYIQVVLIVGDGILYFIIIDQQAHRQK